MSRGPEKDAELDADFYAVFGVNSSATQAEIKKAYRRLVLAYHPDKTSGDTSKLNKFLELQVAFGVLTHVEAKNKYDRLRTARQERDAKATRAREQREQEREEAEGREQREQERKRQDEERKRREQEEKKRREREEAEKQRREEEERKQREAEAEEQRKQKELDKAKREESIKQRYAEEARRMRQRAERAENALDGVQCKGITLKGLRCRNWPSTTRLSHLHCHLHQPNYERWSCKGITQKGIICRLPPSRTLRHREYCHHHLAQAPEDHFSGSEDETETYKFSWSSAMPKTPPQDVLPLSSRRSSSNNPTPVTPLRRTQAGRRYDTSTDDCSSPLTQHTTPTRPAPGPARSARPNVYAEQASSIPASPPTTPEPETNTPSKPSASSKVRPDQASHEDNDYFRTRRNSDRHKTPPTQNSSGHSEPESTRSRWQPTDHGMPTPPETPPEKRSNAISATTPDTSTPSSKVTPEMRESIKLFRKTIPPHLYSNRRKLGDYLAEMIVPRPSPTQGYIYAFKVEPYYRWAIPDTPPKPKLSVIQGYSRQLHAHSLVDILHEDNGEEDFWSSPRSQRQTIKIKIGRSKDVPRRIKEWIGQCKHDCVSVVSYPSLNVTAIEGDTPLDSILVDDVGRVERLLHLVLNDRNIKSERCGCGVLHREWFELEAGQEMADKLEQDIRTCIDLVRMTG